MDNRRTFARNISVVASLALILLAYSEVSGFGNDAPDLTTDTLVQRFRTCTNVLEKHTPAQRFLMLVSTMDGYVTALNGQTGAVQWTLATGTGPLLSSSISNLEILRNGSPSRLVPSLDGGLYHINEDGIEPVPLAADVMLSSSFRFADDSMIIGAKEIESYGINLITGKIRYTCSSEGCKFFDDDKLKSDDGDEVLVISRNDKTVRAVEMQTGQEKWNFSVSQHDISYLFQAAQQEPMKSINEGSTVKEEDAEQCSIEIDGADDTLHYTEPPGLNLDDFDSYDVKLKVLVSTGKVFALSHSSPGLIYWQHQFETAIASSWLLRDGKLSEVDLFNSEIVPILGHSEGFTEYELDGGKNTPVLYLGTFNKQLYVQPSVRFMAEVELATEDALRKGSIVDINMPRVIWRPYLATAGSRTPAVADNQPHLQISSKDNWTRRYDETSMVKWQDNYPFDGGYYLFPDYTPIHVLGESNRTLVAENNSFVLFLLNWWLHILLPMAFILAGAVYASCKLWIKVELKSEPQKSSFEEENIDTDPPVEKTASNATELTSSNSVKDLEKSADYISRFATDFQHDACLGRGGFGVVFKAINRLDDCVYAVKRIALHDSERAREKVMREVKALARLDHPGIVRYYQSWLESPPPGWQEEKDRACLESSLATPSQDCIATDYSCSLQVNPLTSSSVAKFQPAGKRQKNLLRSFDASSDLFNGNGISSKYIPSDCFDNQMNENCMDGSCSNETVSHRASDVDSFDISFRDDGISESGKVGNSSNNSDRCDMQMRRNCSFQHSDDLEIIFEGGDEVSRSRLDTALNTQSLPDGTFTKSPSVSTSSIPEKPKLLQLQEHEANLNDGKKSVKTQKLYLYIQMQLCQQQSLKDWLNDNIEDRDKNRLLDIFHQIVRAISYVHRQGLMHRDLKPSNIFFALDGVVKIGDFGLVTAAEEKCIDEGYASNPSLTTKHTNQVGTTLYMSPEQSISGSYTYKVDIYALGMIFFELFYPFQTQMQRIRMLQDIRQLRLPDDFIKNSPREHEFLWPLLSHDPEERPSTQEILQNAMLVELEEAAEALNRLHSQARQRTLSQSSGNSAGSSSPGPVSVNIS